MMKNVSVFEYVKQGMDDNLFNFTKDGKCIGCGNCCSNLLPMSQKEISVIKKYMIKNRIKEAKHRLQIVNDSYDMTCPFRDNDKKICRIYPVRPEICKQFICDSEKRVKHNRELYKQTRNIILVREEFFNG